MMGQLNDFQLETERRLTERLDELGLQLGDRKISGSTEYFVEGRIDDVQIWIYLDEACVIGRGVDRVFEKWDFSSPEELQTAFIERVVALLTAGDSAAGDDI